MAEIKTTKEILEFLQIIENVAKDKFIEDYYSKIWVDVEQARQELIGEIFELVKKSQILHGGQTATYRQMNHAYDSVIKIINSVLGPKNED